MALSPSMELTEGHVNSTAINGVQWGARLVLTAVLLHFPGLESELELLGFGYNADQMSDDMETL
jgi:hypothetical protein